MEQTINLNMRLTKLEESYFSLSAHLEGERVLRKVEDDKCKQLCDFLAKQIIDVKEKQPAESFNESFISLKEQLINLIDTKIDSKLIENKKQLELQYINNIEKINKNKTIENLESKKLDNEFGQYRFEFNSLYKKVECIDNMYDKKMKEISNKIDDIYNKNNNFIIENDNLINRVNDLNIIINQLQQDQRNNLNKINNDFQEQINLINNNFENKIKNIHITALGNEQKKNSDLNAIDTNLSLLKDDFTSLSNNYLREIDELKKNLNKQNTLKDKEISNFEQHILEEYENFTKFITNILNQNVDKVKSMNEYLNSDIEIIKNKNLYLEETLLKMREDIYDSLEKNVKYVLDKIHSYLEAQNDNIPSNNENIEVNSGEEEQ